MFGCTRGAKDPLLDLFLRLRVNPLAIVREQSPIGLIYIVGKTGKQGPDQQEWRQPYTFNPAIPEIGHHALSTPRLQEVSSTLSSGVELDGAVGVLGRIAALGRSAGAELGTKLQAKGVRRLTFQLIQPEAERLWVDELQQALAGTEFTDAVKVELDGNDRAAFVAVGAWKARSLQVQALSEHGLGIDISAELDQAGKSHGNLDAKKINEFQTYFRSPVPLYFGVELMRIDSLSGGGLHLSSYRPTQVLADDSEKNAVVDAALADIWTEDEEVILRNKGA
jgi:hypothetical protein